MGATEMTNCDALESPPARIESPYVHAADTEHVTILVTPQGDEQLYQGNIHITLTLPHAVTRLKPGMTLKLLPGKYYGAVELVRKKGIVNKDEQKPIIIEGCRDADGQLLSHLCGTNAAGSIYPDLPTRSDYAFFKLRECEHIIIRDLQAESCWPSLIYAEATSNLALERLDVTDGSYVLFARGPGAHHLRIADCHWNQDPTGAMWSVIDWDMIHHGSYAYYNGALAGGIDVHGNVEVVGNTVRNAFNGVRFTTSSDDCVDILGRYNVNVRVHRNTFENIRDNAVEPEKTLLNWHIHDNHIKNTHAAFSFHDYHGGFLYVYDNELWFDDRGGSDFQGNRGGKIYKLRHKGPMPQFPVHIFHNSLYSRNFLIKKTQTRNLLHRNNAVQFCDPRDYEACLCRDDRKLLYQFPVDRHKKPIDWDPSVTFDGDASSKPFGALKGKHNQEQNGLVVRDLGFADPQAGDFTLTAASPLHDAGLVFTLAADKDLPPGQAAWTNSPVRTPPNIGSTQKNGRMALPIVPMTEDEINALLKTEPAFASGQS
jgi:hypothetical protein